MSLSNIAFLARLQAQGRPSFHASRLTFHGSWKRAEHDADSRESFAAVERSMLDKLLGQRTCAFHIRHAVCWILFSR